MSTKIDHRAAFSLRGMLTVCYANTHEKQPKKTIEISYTKYLLRDAELLSEFLNAFTSRIINFVDVKRALFIGKQECSHVN